MSSDPELQPSVEPDDLTLMADDKLLAQVFMNVVKNSIEAFGKCRKGDEISIKCNQEPRWKNCTNS